MTTILAALAAVYCTGFLLQLTGMAVMAFGAPARSSFNHQRRRFAVHPLIFAGMCVTASLWLALAWPMSLYRFLKKRRA